MTIYVQDTIYEEFLRRFVETTKGHDLLGDPFQQGTWQGPQVSKQQHDKIPGYIEEGKKSGAKLLYGGVKKGEKGYFIEPTVFAATTDDMAIVEIFGPVVVIAKFSTLEEVVAKANNSHNGLSSAVFTESLTRAHKLARRLQAGMVFVNSSTDASIAIPFGGYKSSGIGRDLGLDALEAYTQKKSVHVNLGIQLP